MEARPPRSTRKRAAQATPTGWRGLCLCVLAALAACTGQLVPAPPAAPGIWNAALANVPHVRVGILPTAREDFAIPTDALLVFCVDGWRDPGVRLTAAQREGLLQFVAAGGKVLLFGYAAQLASDLAEPERPESAPFRWGFDGRSRLGRARLGLEVVSGRLPELFEGLVDTGTEHTFLLCGGEPCCVPLCSWSVGAPQRGEVLARLHSELDGEPLAAGAPVRAPVLVRWQVGRGEVLACGLQPDFGHADASVRDNALRFVRNCVSVARAGQSGPCVLLPLPPVAVPPPVDLPARFEQRELPMQPLLAHWGWQVPLRGEDDAARPSEEILDQVLAASWCAGADLLELDLCEAQRGAPLPWSARDPLKRPTSYRGDAFWPGWSAATIGGLASEAHARGLLLQAAVDPLPAGDKVAERLVALRFLGRELADVRRLGAGALDGFGVRQWQADPSGYGLAMLQDFQPAGYFYRSGERVPAAGGALRALDADDGAVPGLAVTGLSAGFRDGFPADQFPLGVLDARRERRPGEALGGGAYPDWLVAQAHDFVRARRGLGGALWWRAGDPATLGRQTVAYVQGLGQEPLRAAVAMRLSATGADGYRAAAARLCATAPAGFGGEVPVPAALHVLQNNWFRLLGTGGPLLFDPQGLAQFRPDEAVSVSPAFVRTRLFGGRPDADALRSDSRDLLADGWRGEGGYGRAAVVGGPRPEDRQLPAQLAFAAAPQWPQQVAVELHLGLGYHELQLQGRPVQGRGILVVSLDDAVLQCLAFAEGQPLPALVVPLHIARPGVRILQFAVAEGGSLAFDRLRVVRTGDVAAEAQIDVPAGSLAQLSERSASSYHQEHLELRALADLPGFLLRIRCQRAVRSLQIERTFQLPGHHELVRCGTDDSERRLRGTFVLRAADADLPDLVVVPLQLARYEHFTLRDGVLVMVSTPETGLESRCGFLLAPRNRSGALADAAAAIFGALDQPHEFDLGDAGEATLVNDLPVAWTRVVHLRQHAQSPYGVRENGWWTWRGAMPAPNGGDWLRVCLLPGDTVQIVGGPALLARTRPGPGSLQVLALRDPSPASVTVRVLQPCRLVAPSVVMAADFDAVFVDGKPWAWFAGRTVFLPDRVGTYTIETRTHRGGSGPHVTATRAPLRQCEYVADRRELVLVADADPARPVELPFTAILQGPVPTGIENGEIVADATLRHADPEAAAAAAAGGVLIRFRAGVTRVSYGN